MFEMVYRVIHDPMLIGECFLQPAKMLSNQLTHSLSRIQAIFKDIIFFITHSDLIPPEESEKQALLLTTRDLPKEPTFLEPTLRLTSEEICLLQIGQVNHKSDRILFKHDLFNFSRELSQGECYFRLNRRRDPRFKHHSFTRILLTEGMTHSLKPIFWIVANILALPVTLPLTGIGCVLKLGSLYCGSSPQKRLLNIKEIEPNEAKNQEIDKTIRIWQDLAIQKKENVNEKNEKSIFSDARNINKLIAQCIENPNECTLIYDSVLLCYDVALQALQAIALICKDYEVLTTSSVSKGHYLKIAHMATHPHNIRSSINTREYTRVEGAATALIVHLAQRCLQDKQAGIYLESIASAIPFYEKLGFKCLENEITPEEWGTVPMQLTTKKIKKLAENHMFPFANLVIP